MIDLKRFRKDNGISQAELQRILNCKQPYISALENGDRPINDEVFIKLNSHYGERIQPYILPANIANKYLKKAHTLEQKRTTIPYYDIDFMAGTAEVFSEPERPDYYIDIPPFNNCDLALPIFGDSMYPIYQNGDIVMCREIKDKSIIPLGEAFLIVTKEHRMLKYLKRGPSPDTLLAVSENSEQYDPFPIKIDNMERIYIVKGVIKRKTI